MSDEQSRIAASEVHKTVLPRSLIDERDNFRPW
jgi:hypothetical protein